jgi:ribonuclease R
LGQQLAVRVVRVNLEERKIDFELDDSAAEKQGLNSKERAKKTAKRSGNRSRKTAGAGYNVKGKKSTSRRKSKASSKKTGKKRSK